MASGTKVTEITQISDLTGVNDVYVNKGNNFYRISLEAFFADCTTPAPIPRATLTRAWATSCGIWKP